MKSGGWSKKRERESPLGSCRKFPWWCANIRRAAKCPHHENIIYVADTTLRGGNKNGNVQLINLHNFFNFFFRCLKPLARGGRKKLVNSSWEAFSRFCSQKKGVKSEKIIKIASIFKARGGHLINYFEK